MTTNRDIIATKSIEAATIRAEIESTNEKLDNELKSNARIVALKDGIKALRDHLKKLTASIDELAQHPDQTDHGAGLQEGGK